MSASIAVVLLLPVLVFAQDATAGKVPSPSWTFAVSGDSRNCGDVVMPSIAQRVRENGAVFYWHLGDLRWITDIDEDYAQTHPGARLESYEPAAWDDFIQNQIVPFGDLPFLVGIGNHETKARMNRERFISQFSRWLDNPTLRAQRLQDDARATEPRTYYHWRRDGIEFVNLDNATGDQFDEPQRAWLTTVLAHAAADSGISALVVGMHEALPDSLARGHSMSDSTMGETSGRAVYTQLLALGKTKPVYVLASHSHYYMGGVFDTPYWRAHGGVLKGWIVGTAGARRYTLPHELNGNEDHRQHTYGFLLATVNPVGTPDRVRFEFREVTEAEVPTEVVARYGPELIHWCYARNP